MENEIERFPIMRLTREGRSSVEDFSVVSAAKFSACEGAS